MFLFAPFPFISIQYKSFSEFNAPPSANHINLKITMDIAQKSKLQKMILNHNINLTGDIFEDITSISRLTRIIMHNSNGNIIRKVNEVASSMKNFKSICSESSKVFITIMDTYGYTGRVIWMNGHTVSEIYHKGHGWIMVDTYGNLIFKDANGHLQSMLDINKNFEKLTPIHLTERIHDDNPDYFESRFIFKKNNTFNNQNLFVVIDNSYLDSFHKKTRSIPDVLKYLLFGKEFARGIQFAKPSEKKVGNVGVEFYKRF